VSGASAIEWTDATWNPVRGCRKISPGCKHCYAETFAERWRGVAGHAYERGFDPRTAPDQLTAPLKWRSPKTIFVNSMSDLFLEDFEDWYIDQVFGVMWATLYVGRSENTLTEGHVYQLLTKRPERALAYLSTDRSKDWARAAVNRGGGKDPDGVFDQTLTEARKGPHPRIQVGVSVEDRKYGVPRIDVLRRIPAAVRFLSVEPLLEDVGKLDLAGIHQVIVGAESGRGARPFQEDWARSLRDQCQEQGVAFFYKQKLDARGRKVSLPMLDGKQLAEPAVSR
jgi:protein gp37